MLSQEQASVDGLVGAYMTVRPITVELSAPVAEAASLLCSCRIRHLPVVDGDRLAGMVSVRDVIGADGERRVGELLPGPLIAATADWTVRAACEEMLERRLSGLAVADGARLIGIFTATDALRLAVRLLERERREPAPVAQVTRLMTPRPLATVQPTTLLTEAWQRMRTAGVRHLPVLSGDAVVAILCDRDVLAVGGAWLRAPQRAAALLVADAMSPRVVTIEAERPALDAARLLLRRRLGALPVMRGHELRGMLTVTDFLYWLTSLS